MDYHEQQINEIEILKCIYMDDMKVHSEIPIFELEIRLHYDQSMEKKIPIIITLPEKYPSEPFNLKIGFNKLLSKKNMNDILDFINKFKLENIGGPILFEALSSIQDKIYYISSDKEMEEQLVNEFDKTDMFQSSNSVSNTQTNVICCDEKINGTEVTVESFNAWKTKFEQEMNINYNQCSVNSRFDSQKMTGKQFFEQGLDKNITYLEIDGELIELDEKLLEENINGIL